MSAPDADDIDGVVLEWTLPVELGDTGWFATEAPPIPRLGCDDVAGSGGLRVRCAYPREGQLVIDGHALRVVESWSGGEHEGESEHDSVLVMVAGSDVVGVLTQWSESLTLDGGAFRARRGAVVDVDGDGHEEVCIETIVADGAWPEGDEAWRPEARTRWLSAFRYDGEENRFVRVPEVDDACPEDGYTFLLAPDESAAVSMLDPELECEGACGEPVGWFEGP
ncbi:MAG: hypothetical protein KDA28_08395 [Phycisphaerales bacterium]|nr:hypothetical protein [Phycisphaerales bacterium]